MVKGLTWKVKTYLQLFRDAVQTLLGQTLVLISCPDLRAPSGHQTSAARCYLSWSAHIESICTKARKQIGLLYRRFYGNIDDHSLLELYSVLVRPHLEYAAPVWDPHLTKYTNKLESVQKFALKCV